MNPYYSGKLMVTTIETPVQNIVEKEEGEYVFVFTEASSKGYGVSYTAVIGEKTCIDRNTKAIVAIESDLMSGGLYIISISSSSLCSRAYGGTVEFNRSGNTYFAAVFPDWSIPGRLPPAQRWRFRYIAFEYPRGGKKGFLLPTINDSPFAYCFINSEERQTIEHLCPPMPVARYVPEEYGYESGELSRYLVNEEEKRRHASELFPIIDSIFARCGGDKGQYLPMDKEIIPKEYRDYQMLYNAESLGDW